jgi:hypothetical protein
VTGRLSQLLAAFERPDSPLAIVEPQGEPAIGGIANDDMVLEQVANLGEPGLHLAPQTVILRLRPNPIDDVLVENTHMPAQVHHLGLQSGDVGLECRDVAHQSG